ncbi:MULTISPECIES: hypothetical protein [Streptacidiphilus]|uniref:Uncharacterized protein n=1 Tax=Streptacidiphilus cavernicola TaxID=3342716 RepID=A0ABV6UWL3_9ACTN|nr:hypothetical protein [Streptacidiphilus jeojiense]
MNHDDDNQPVIPRIPGIPRPRRSPENPQPKPNIPGQPRRDS